MIKRFTFLMITVALLIVFTGCAQNAGGGGRASGAEQVESSEAIPATSQNSAPPPEPVEIRIGGLKGPTSMGMVKLLKDAEQKQSYYTYDFTLAGAADELTPKLINGELDIAAVPANLASALYNNTGGKIKLLAINTLGVLYIVEKGENVKTLSDLKGKTIFATGRGTAPEYALNYLLVENGIDPGKDVVIEWKNEPTEVVALMAQNQASIAMMPQPYVTVAQGAIENLRIAIDLTKEWDALNTESMLLTGVLIIRSEFADGNPDQIAKFLEEYKASTEFVNANIKEASILIEEFDIVKADVAEKALPFCNIVFYAGDDMKTAMHGYLEALYNQNPQSVGGTMPDDNFYYGAQ